MIANGFLPPLKPIAIYSAALLLRFLELKWLREAFADAYLSCIIALVMACNIPAFAQAANENGLVPYGAYHGSEFDLVSVLNGHLELRIPIKDFPQRGGKLKLTFIARYNNAVWNERKECPPITGGCFFFWDNNGGPMGAQFGA